MYPVSICSLLSVCRGTTLSEAISILNFSYCSGPLDGLWSYCIHYSTPPSYPSAPGPGLPRRHRRVLTPSLAAPSRTVAQPGQSQRRDLWGSWLLAALPVLWVPSLASGPAWMRSCSLSWSRRLWAQLRLLPLTPALSAQTVSVPTASAPSARFLPQSLGKRLVFS